MERTMTIRISRYGGRLRFSALLIASLLATGGSARAQLGSPATGLPSFGLGTPGAPSPLGTGIPLGAVELGTAGLSPPVGATPFAVPVAPGLSGGASGFGPSPAMVSPLGPASSGSGMGITNYGVGGMQTLPGSASGGIP
jgi:hypothetical protein